MSNPSAEIFLKAAELSVNCPLRRGNVLHVTGGGKTVVSGDIHGVRSSMNNILTRFAAPDKPLLVFQEIIHGPSDPQGHDRSIELLLRAARLKCQNPGRVHFVLGNHDLAQFTGGEITKEGRGVCDSFKEGVKHCFGDGAYEVYSAAMAFFRSLPLAIKFDNGVMVSHSLPSPNRMKFFSPAILENPCKEEDLKRGGAVYELVWGRDQTPQQLEELSQMLGAEFFLLGHRHINEGLLEIPERAVAINSNTSGGCIVEFDAGIDTISLSNIGRYVKRISQL